MGKNKLSIGFLLSSSVPTAEPSADAHAGAAVPEDAIAQSLADAQRARDSWDDAISTLRGLDGSVLDTLARAGKVSAAVRSGVAARRSRFERALRGVDQNAGDKNAAVSETKARLARLRGAARARPY
jgi:hypothetical protein